MRMTPMVAVVVVPHLFQACGFEAVSLVDDEELSESAGSGFGVHERVNDSVFGVVPSEASFPDPKLQSEPMHSTGH
jgi:hypothetical protein